MKNLFLEKGGIFLVLWIFREKRDFEWFKRVVFSLRDLCLFIFVKNVDVIFLFKYVLDVLRDKFS